VIWIGYGKKQSWPNLRYYPSIWLEGLSKTTKTLSQDSQFLGQGLNPEPSECEAGMQRHLVMNSETLFLRVAEKAESNVSIFQFCTAAVIFLILE
jgi:hypothetical protein